MFTSHRRRGATLLSPIERTVYRRGETYQWADLGVLDELGKIGWLEGLVALNDLERWHSYHMDLLHSQAAKMGHINIMRVLREYVLDPLGAMRNAARGGQIRMMVQISRMYPTRIRRAPLDSAVNDAVIYDHPRALLLLIRWNANIDHYYILRKALRNGSFNILKLLRRLDRRGEQKLVIDEDVVDSTDQADVQKFLRKWMHEKTKQ